MKFQERFVWLGIVFVLGSLLKWVYDRDLRRAGADAAAIEILAASVTRARAQADSNRQAADSLRAIRTRERQQYEKDLATWNRLKARWRPDTVVIARVDSFPTTREPTPEEIFVAADRLVQRCNLLLGNCELETSRLRAEGDSLRKASDYWESQTKIFKRKADPPWTQDVATAVKWGGVGFLTCMVKGAGK